MIESLIYEKQTSVFALIISFWGISSRDGENPFLFRFKALYM
jgi:hypothetical protein